MSHDIEFTKEEHNLDYVIEPFPEGRSVVDWLNLFRTTDELWLGGGEYLGSVRPDNPQVGVRYPILIAFARITRTTVRHIPVGATNLVDPKKNEQRILRWSSSQISAFPGRDPLSVENLLREGVETVFRSADPVFAYQRSSQDELNITAQSSRDTLAVSARDPHFKELDIDSLVEGLNNVTERLDCHIKLLPMDTSTAASGSPSDIPVLTKIRNQLDAPAEIADVDNFKQKFDVIANAQLLIGVRLHSIIPAINCRTPFVPISYEPKCDAHFKMLSEDRYFDVDQIDPDELAELVLERWEDDEFYAKREDSIRPIEERASNIVRDVLDRSDEKSRIYLSVLTVATAAELFKRKIRGD